MVEDKHIENLLVITDKNEQYIFVLLESHNICFLLLIN